MKMKKVVALLAMLAVLCTAFSGLTLIASAATLVTSYESSTYVEALTINAVDSYRFADTIVLFKPGFDALPLIQQGWGTWNDGNAADIYAAGGPGYTSTSPWGTEVIVNEYGIVTKITTSGNGGNAKIPTGGFVLSGNGAGATTLNNNVKIGDHIVLRDGSDADAEKDQFDVFRTTEDSQYTADSKACQIDNTLVLKVTDGGSGVTTGSTVWQNDVLIKKSGGTASDGSTHVGYVVQFGGNDIDVPSGYFALTFSGQSQDKGGVYGYNGSDLFKRFAAPGALVNIGGSHTFFRYDVAAAIRGAYLMTGLTNTSLAMSVDKVYDYSAATLLANAKKNYDLVDIDAMQ
ncbi:MAG: hypothetical protein IJC52_01835, partial [Clostridia bacterium]|nr:hypothetical protein [Clostridia bacterium]